MSWIIPEAGPDFVCAMEEVLDVYVRRYDPLYPVVCLDESPCQLIGEKRKTFTDKYGTVRVDYEYIRNGTADIFMVTEPLGGGREVFVRDRHIRLEWAEITAYLVEKMFPEAERITLIQDNLRAHKKSALYELFQPERARSILEKLEFVFTPKHGSWLNIAEIELSVLTRQGLKGRIATKEELVRQCDEWCTMRNEKGAARRLAVHRARREDKTEKTLPVNLMVQKQ